MPNTMNMSLLSMMEAKLPPGFRFHPRDEELVCDYLARKVAGDGDGDGSFSGCLMMIDVDLNKCEPWDLPETACVGGKEWYFFSLRDRKYATGQRTNRATLSGYWKATGKDRPVARKGVLVGMRKTLVFYQGRAPKGRKTDWVMHEFRMEGNGSDPPRFPFKEDWVLCRVFYKSRGNSSKPSKETCYDDTSSSMLPPLTDIYITSEETPQSLKGYEQVPCFSKLPLNINQVVVPPIPMTERNTPFKNTTHLGGLPNLGSCLNPLPCDKKVVEVVLNHLTKLEGNQKREVPTTLAEGSQESYFPGISQPYIWNIF